MRQLRVLDCLIKHDLLQNRSCFHTTLQATSHDRKKKSEMQRVLGVDTDLFTRKRGKISDDSFEKQLLLKIYNMFNYFSAILQILLRNCNWPM